jgi:hypothetical protein
MFFSISQKPMFENGLSLQKLPKVLNGLPLFHSRLIMQLVTDAENANFCQFQRKMRSQYLGALTTYTSRPKSDAL